ncbi:hypothetical protein LTR78_009341 [Recurvomyces mirabilis]|uniref:Protein kinase domain-containing protein n=1 Tax=Recurvomyces mirabilis TaxID=574656 RepID=A0AAE0TNV7_9PEZI|nr:hypothetical protein LTR78_009341 [Recurvomyces mirabilis]
MNPLNRRNTVWPRASDTTQSTSVVVDSSPPKSSASQHKRQKPDLLIQVPPHGPIPTPPAFSTRALDINTVSIELRNPYDFPTSKNLDHSIVVTNKSIWKMYDPIVTRSNQGPCQQGFAILSRRKVSQRGTVEGDVIVKAQALTMPLKHFAKPRCQNLVELYGAFRSRDTLWLLYEEMTVSLEQVFALDHSPWIVNPDQQHTQISSISQQLLLGLEYVNRYFERPYGELSPEGILLDRSGAVKLANIGAVILKDVSVSGTTDLQAFVRILVRLLLPLEREDSIAPSKVDPLAYDFYLCATKHDFTALLNHSYLSTANPQSLTKLVMWTSKSVYDPPLDVSSPMLFDQRDNSQTTVPPLRGKTESG